MPFQPTSLAEIYSNVEKVKGQRIANAAATQNMQFSQNQDSRQAQMFKAQQDATSKATEKEHLTQALAMTKWVQSQPDKAEALRRIAQQSPEAGQFFAQNNIDVNSIDNETASAMAQHIEVALSGQLGIVPEQAKFTPEDPTKRIVSTLNGVRSVVQEPTAKLSGGGTSADMQWMNRYSAAFPDATDEDVFSALDAYKSRFANAERAGVGGVVNSKTGAFVPQTNIGTVAGNAGMVSGATAGGATTGKGMAERALDAPTAKAKIGSINSKFDLLVNKAQGLADNKDLGRAVGLLAYIPSIWGGKAANIDAAVDSLAAQLGFNELQEMRQNSPTGGALGNVSDTEGVWLRNSVLALKQSQSAEQFRDNLLGIIQYTQGAKARLNKAFSETYSQARPASAPSSPSAPNETAADRYKRLKGG
jgi:hypothetical protein